MAELPSFIKPGESGHFSVSVEESRIPRAGSFVIGTLPVSPSLRPTFTAGSQDYIHKVTLATKPLTADEGASCGASPGTSSPAKTDLTLASTQELAESTKSVSSFESKRSKSSGEKSQHSSSRSYGDPPPADRVDSSMTNSQHFSAEAQESHQSFPLLSSSNLQPVSSDSAKHAPQLVLSTHHSPSPSMASQQSGQVHSPSPSMASQQPGLLVRPSETELGTVPSLSGISQVHSSLTTPEAVAPSSPLPPPLRYSERDPDYQAVKTAAECLHAQDYSKMASTLENAPRTVVAAFGLGLAYYKMAKYSLATRSFEDMLHRSESNPELLGNVYLAHYYIGEIDLGHGRYEQASRHFEQSAAAFCTQTIAKRYRIVPPSLAILHSKRGSALNHSQKVMAAVDSYKRAISLAVTPKDKLAAHTSLGNLYQSVGDNQSAKLQYEETIQLAEELRDYVYLGWAHGNMGNAYLGLFQKDKALYHLEKSLELTVKHEPSPQAIGRAYNNLGTAHQSLGDVTKAEEYYDLALSQAIYGRDVGGQARAYGNIGNLLMIQKKYESAIIHYTEALSISKDRSTKSTAYHNRGCASYEKAEADKRKFFDRLDKQSALLPQEGGVTVVYRGPNVHRLPQAPAHLPSSIGELYEQGRNDLMKVIDNHEETIQTIKGSTQGLTLSVSLSETNSRTFHRLQDCLVNLGQWDQALEYAEQSRARSLGELLLERKGRTLELPLTSPLTTQQVNRIIDKVNTTVVYVSYTGSRLLVWVFTPVHGYTTTNMFQVSLADDQFDGKSLDYYLRYSLSEILIDSNMEMYSVTTYEEPSPLTVLFDLFGRPLLTVLESVYSQTQAREAQEIVLIPDSYTNLMPMVALLNLHTQQFLGDRFRFQYMPSILTMGILYQQPEVVVEVLEESRSFCVVGNPAIPPFKYQGDTWNLGKLPHATREAEWVAHILKCQPTLHEQATKMVVLSMMNTAKVVHLATHGSATSGFLAFAGRGSSRSKEVSEERLVLLYPEEVEKLSISPALVVLSSCDSGRGVVKADGIQGMARAFILAGAQSVLTSLWRVPDESASTFMQFFYQYMMDGHQSTVALQKAILSVRAFSKYSRYIHWSGYQLSGREVRLVVKKTDQDLRGRVGAVPVFPRLHVVKKLESVFINDPRTPTDMQVVHGVHGLKPSEPVIEFIVKCHAHFTGGVFWVNGSSAEFISAGQQAISEALAAVPSANLGPVLVVLDNISSLPNPLVPILKSNNTHIVAIIHSISLPDNLRKQVDHQLIRGLNVISLKPLSRLHSTQRVVHSVVSQHEFTPHSREQDILAKIADRVGGSPSTVSLTSALLGRCIEECVDGESGDFLSEFSNRVLQFNDQPITQFIAHLIDGFKLSQTEHLLLTTLAMFGPVPIPKSTVDKTQSYVMMAKPSSESPGSLMPVSNLISAKLLLVYPAPVVVPPSSSERFSVRKTNSQLEEEADYFYVPQLIRDALWEGMDPLDREVAITTAYKCLEVMCVKKNARSADRYILFGVGLVRTLIELLESKGKDLKDKNLLDLNCYQELIRLYVNLRVLNV